MTHRIPLRTFALALAVMLGLSACTGEPPPPCPFARVDSTTARLTEYGDTRGRDVTDVAYEVNLVSFEGDCIHRGDGVDVVMDIDFVVTTGASAAPGEITFEYFVAIPQYYPDPAGKQVFPITLDLPRQTGARTRLTEENVRVFIPLRDREPAASYDVYMGLQIDALQLRDNQNRQRGG